MTRLEYSWERAQRLDDRADEVERRYFADEEFKKMTKKSSKPARVAESDVAIEVAPEAPETPAAPALIEGQWQPGQWNGIDQLTCVNCKWDTLEGIEAAHEYKSKCPRCAPPVEPPPPARTLFIEDRWGNVVEPTHRVEQED